MKWAGREEWRDSFSEITERHLGPACSGADIEIGELPDLIGDHWFTTLWGCAFEDLISRTVADGRNVADDYLKRRGWKESASTRAYITALRSSFASLYEVSGIVVGESFLARDMVRGGEPVRLREVGDQQPYAMGSHRHSGADGQRQDLNQRRCSEIRSPRQ